MKTSELDLPEGVEFLLWDSPGAAAKALAETVAGKLRERLAEAGRATLVVSGGSTPIPFFDDLSRAELDWSRVTVLLADERWVPETDSASNTALVRARLLQNNAGSAEFLPLKYPIADPWEAVPQIEAGLSRLMLPLDVLVLGMGTDGHTASLFPDAPQLAQAMAPDHGQRAAIMTPPSQAQARITLTLPTLRSARYTALHVRGADKVETLAKAVGDPGDWRSMPIRAFLDSGLEIYWSG